MKDQINIERAKFKEEYMKNSGEGAASGKLILNATNQNGLVIVDGQPVGSVSSITVYLLPSQYGYNAGDKVCIVITGNAVLESQDQITYGSVEYYDVQPTPVDIGLVAGPVYVVGDQLGNIWIEDSASETVTITAFLVTSETPISSVEMTFS